MLSLLIIISTESLFRLLTLRRNPVAAMLSWFPVTSDLIRVIDWFDMLLKSSELRAL